MIHRALMGSFERFIGILIEHYAGEFPLWLAPVQALVLPIADRHVDYAREVAGRLRERGHPRRDRRALGVDRQEDPRGRAAKVPYMLVVGDPEQEAGEVAVRRHREGDLGAVPVEEFARDSRPLPRDPPMSALTSPQRMTCPPHPARFDAERTASPSADPS